MFCSSVFRMMSTFLVMLGLLLVVMLAEGDNIGNVAMPNCPVKCGEVQIPYPFGVGDSCYYSKAYEIICNTSFSPPKPFLPKFGLEVLEISWAGRYSYLDPRYNEHGSASSHQRLTVGVQSPNLCESNGPKIVQSYNLSETPFLFSRWYNVFMVEGCGGSVVLKNRSGDVLTGCASFCGKTYSCYGVGCCQASLLSSPTSDYIYKDSQDKLDFYEIALDFEQLQTKSNSCNISAVLIESASLSKYAVKLSTVQKFPTVLEWQGIYRSSGHCYDYSGAPQCYCYFPYHGNPYLPNGCQLMEECRKCKRWCAVLYNSTDSSSYIGCSYIYLKGIIIVGVSCGMGFILLVLGCYFLYRCLKKRKQRKQEKKNFKRNGGLLLQQQLSSSDGVVDKTKLYTVAELQKATDNFSENRILGRGGQGTVYKGMLRDGRIVAIKKSKIVDETQVEPFINEVVLLSQINHRNVVGLSGCCLETEVPTLVYEFIPNGTLYEHIHGQGDDFLQITWKMRLQIAAESAGAIAYLHSSSSAPIYHRDIKSTNILLDEKYRAKVSDFGTSKAITIDQTHVTTAVQGTYGYLDPEYFQTNMYTDKSDVYSFGVVLVELLTGKKPIHPTGDGGWISLAAEFLSKMEDSHLSDILDSSIVDEGKEYEFTAVAELARRCLYMNGKQRPTMKEVAVQLDAIRTSSQMPVSREVKSAESSRVQTEVINFDSGPSNMSTFSIDEESPVSSIEVQPLMSRT